MGIEERMLVDQLPKIQDDVDSCLNKYECVDSIELTVRCIPAEGPDLAERQEKLAQQLEGHIRETRGFKGAIVYPCEETPHVDVRLEVIYGSGEAYLSFDQFCELNEAPDQKPPAKRNRTQECLLIKARLVHSIRNPVILAGNYLKLARNVSNSPMNINGNLITKYSVSEFITKVTQEVLEGKVSAFHSGGREDIDVRMMGSGRPFIVSVEEAKYRPSEEMVETIKARVSKEACLDDGMQLIEIKDLRDAGVTSLSKINKKLEEMGVDKKKTYGSVIYHPNGFDEKFIKFLKDKVNKDGDG